MLIDERGRLFGKVNLIDAGVGVLVLLLIPLGYVAYALFRTPVPTITSVERVPVPGGEGYRLRVLGEDLRPYLKVTLGTHQATFLVESPNAGEVSVPELEPGTYDLVLYDETRELTRVPGALVIAPPTDAPDLAIQELIRAQLTEAETQLQTVTEALQVAADGRQRAADILAAAESRLQVVEKERDQVTNMVSNLRALLSSGAWGQGKEREMGDEFESEPAAVDQAAERPTR